MASYSTQAEFIIRELHDIVRAPCLYDWDEVWLYLRDYADTILEDPETKAFRWNPESVYMQAPGALYNLLDSYALDELIVEKRYIEGEIWTRRTTFNTVTGVTRRVTYTTDIHDLVVVYAQDGTRQTTVGQFHDGKHLPDPDAAWAKVDRAWHSA